MAYSFNGTSQYLSTSTPPVTTMPLTMACWFRVSVASAASTRIILNAGAATSASACYRLVLPVNNTVVRANQTSDAGASAVAQTATGAVVANTWIHAAAVFASSELRTVYASTASGVSDTISLAAPTLTNFSVGSSVNSGGVGGYFSGLVAEVGVWAAAISADEILSLSRGISPHLVRPQSLVFYAPLIRNLTDARAGRTITNNGSATVTDHPRVYA